MHCPAETRSPRDPSTATLSRVTEMVTHWPVLEQLTLHEDERDADGFLTDGALTRLFAEVRGAYAAGCKALDLTAAEVRDVVVRRGSVPAPGADASVSVAVVEVFPESFTMEARVRPAEGLGIAGSATCTVVPAGGAVSRELKAELIALAQTARHLH